MHKPIAMLSLLTAATICLPAAAITHTTGPGSAVNQIHARADFESQAALESSYVEGGMSFSRNGLATGNGGCGFAGCSGYQPFSAFDGNYMYGGVGALGQGFFTIQALDGRSFEALEFTVSSGRPMQPFAVSWTALLDGVEVGSGTATGLGFGTVLGFHGGAFDEIRFNDSNNAIAFDKVRAGFIAAVPEPTSVALLLPGLGVIAFAAKRRRQG